jgi:hypothetical protein
VLRPAQLHTGAQRVLPRRRFKGRRGPRRQRRGLYTRPLLKNRLCTIGSIGRIGRRIVGDGPALRGSRPRWRPGRALRRRTGQLVQGFRDSCGRRVAPLPWVATRSLYAFDPARKLHGRRLVLVIASSRSMDNIFRVPFTAAASLAAASPAARRFEASPAVQEDGRAKSGSGS